MDELEGMISEFNLLNKEYGAISGELKGILDQTTVVDYGKGVYVGRLGTTKAGTTLMFQVGKHANSLEAVKSFELYEIIIDGETLNLVLLMVSA